MLFLVTDVKKGDFILHFLYMYSAQYYNSKRLRS